MKDNLNEEILRQLSLIKFDRSKTLLEQNSIVVEFTPSNIHEDITKKFIISEQIPDEPQPKRKGIPDGAEELGLVSPQEWEEDAKREAEKARKGFCFTNLNKFRAGLKKSEYLSDESWNAVKNRYLPNGFFDCWNEFKKSMTSKQFADLIYKTWWNYYNNNKFVSTDTAAIMLERYINEMNQSTYNELLKIIKSKSPTGTKPECIKKSLYKYEYVIDWIQLRYFNPKGVGELPTFVDEKQERLLKSVAKLLQSKFGDVPKNAYTRFNSCLPEGYTFFLPTLSTTIPGIPHDGFAKYNISGRSKDWVEGFHAYAPWVGLCLQIFGGLPGMVIGSTLDFIDGLIYLNYDKDPYMATVSFIFALVPIPAIRGELGAARVTQQEAKTFLRGILRKLNERIPLTAMEELFLKGLLKNKEIMKEVGLQVLVKLAKQAAKEYGPRGLMRFIRYFHKLGYRMITGRAVFINLFGAQFLFDLWVSENWDNPECRGNFQFSELIGTIIALFKSEGGPENWNPNNLRQWFLNSWLVDFPQPFTKSKSQCLKIEAYKTAILMKEFEEKSKINSLQILTRDVLENIKNSGTVYESNKYEDDYRFLVIQNLLLNIPLDLSTWATKNNKPMTVKLKSDKSKTFDFMTIENAKTIKKITIASAVAGKITHQKNYSNQEKIEIDLPKTNSLRILTIETQDGKKYYEKIFPGTVWEFYATNVGSPINFVPSKFDNNMKLGLIAYQQVFGLDETGKLDKQTIEKMLKQVNDNYILSFKNLNKIPETEEQTIAYIKELVKQTQKNEPPMPSDIGTHNPPPIDEKKIEKMIIDTVNYYNITPQQMSDGYEYTETN